MWLDSFRETPDQSSPQATVEGFKRAMGRKNWRLALRYLSPKAQQALVGAALMGSGYATDGDLAASQKLAKIMRKHGFRKQQKADIANVDLLKVIRDLMRWSERHLPQDKKLDLVENVVNTEYSNWRIDDDRAYVIATLRKRQSETRLKCVDGLWYLI